MDEQTGFCLGCARKLEEVAVWRRMSDAQRQAVMDVLPARKEAMKAQGIDIRWRD